MKRVKISGTLVIQELAEGKMREIKEQKEAEGILLRSEADRDTVLHGVAIEGAIISELCKLDESIEGNLLLGEEMAEHLADQRFYGDKGAVLISD